MISFDGNPKETYEPLAAYAKWLQETNIPKLLLYVMPGGIIKEKDLQWIRDHFSNIEYVDLGEGMHYVQEDHPHKIGRAISDWYARL